MATPSEKAPAMEEFLEEQYGRSSAIKADKCIKPPVGCGGPATEFQDNLSKREYTISGLCQKCQDRIFGGTLNMSGNGMQLNLDEVGDMCKEANVEDLSEVIDDFDKICELLQTGSICAKIGKDKIFITLVFERAPDDAEYSCEV